MCFDIMFQRFVYEQCLYNSECILWHNTNIIIILIDIDDKRIL